jgi:anti-anti-sigma regulatory factor
MTLHSGPAEDGSLVLALPEQFYPHHPGRLISRLAAQIGTGQVKHLVLDLRRTVLVSADGVTVLQALSQLTGELGVPTTAVVPNADLRRLLSVFGLAPGTELVASWPQEFRER